MDEGARVVVDGLSNSVELFNVKRGASYARRVVLGFILLVFFALVHEIVELAVQFLFFFGQLDAVEDCISHSLTAI